MIKANDNLASLAIDVKKRGQKNIGYTIKKADKQG